MQNRSATFLTIFFASLASIIMLAMPSNAAAQGGYDPYYGRRRDNDDRRYENNIRQLHDVVRRVEKRSDDFEDRLDSALDRSRYDDSRREDRINDVAREFKQAAERLDSRLDDDSRNDFNNSRNDARNLLRLGSRIDDIMRRNRLDGRTESTWAQIRQDLRYIADAYGFRNDNFDYRNDRNDRNDRGRGRGRGRGNGRGGYWGY